MRIGNASRNLGDVKRWRFRFLVGIQNKVADDTNTGKSCNRHSQRTLAKAFSLVKNFCWLLCYLLWPCHISFFEYLFLVCYRFWNEVRTGKLCGRIRLIELCRIYVFALLNFRTILGVICLWISFLGSISWLAGVKNK